MLHVDNSYILGGKAWGVLTEGNLGNATPTYDSANHIRNTQIRMSRWGSGVIIKSHTPRYGTGSNINSGFQIQNCTISNNHGTGVYIESSCGVIENCEINSNGYRDGVEQALRVFGIEVRLSDIIVHRNRVLSNASYGLHAMNQSLVYGRLNFPSRAEEHWDEHLGLNCFNGNYYSVGTNVNGPSSDATVFFGQHKHATPHEAEKDGHNLFVSMSPDGYNMTAGGSTVIFACENYWNPLAVNANLGARIYQNDPLVTADSTICTQPSVGQTDGSGLAQPDFMEEMQYYEGTGDYASAFAIAASNIGVISDTIGMQAIANAVFICALYGNLSQALDTLVSTSWRTVPQTQPMSLRETYMIMRLWKYYALTQDLEMEMAVLDTISSRCEFTTWPDLEISVRARRAELNLQIGDTATYISQMNSLFAAYGMHEHAAALRASVLLYGVITGDTTCYAGKAPYHHQIGKPTAPALVLYPNPSGETVVVNVPYPADEDGVFVLIGMDGNIVLRRFVGRDEKSIMLDAHGLLPGVYLAILYRGLERYHGKIVVE